MSPVSSSSSKGVVGPLRFQLFQENNEEDSDPSNAVVISGRRFFKTGGLKDGDKLHEGLFANLKNEQHWQLIKELKIQNADQHRELLQMLLKISDEFFILKEIDKQNGPLEKHRKRVFRIAKAARELSNAIAEEPLLPQLLMTAVSTPETLIEGKITPELWMSARQFADELRERLPEFAHYAELTASFPGFLDQMRISNPSPFKSAERLYVWEPIFEFMANNGLRVGFSEKGPTLRILSVLHEALGIVPPNPFAVRQALEDFNSARKPGAVPRSKNEEVPH